MTLRQEVKLDVGRVWSLKRIDDELWCCHGKGITVYSFDLKKLRNLLLHSVGHKVHSAVSLDINTVVIATIGGSGGLSTCSKQGLSIHPNSLFTAMRTTQSGFCRLP